MTVFVDDMYLYPMGEFRRGNRVMKMSHMISDTDAELHAMAAKIGVAQRWWQAPPAHDSHYDIAMSARAKAVSFGAVEITLRQCSAMCMVRRATGSLPGPAEAEARAEEIRAERKALQAARHAAMTPEERMRAILR